MGPLQLFPKRARRKTFLFMQNILPQERNVRKLSYSVTNFNQIHGEMALQAPPKELMSPMNIPQKLLMGPGPSNASPRVLAASALPLLGHLHPEFTKIMDDIKTGIQYLFQTKSQYAFAISGTGHCGMEAMVFNMVEPGDVVLVADHGIWGERFADLCLRVGADVRHLRKPYGEGFQLDEIEAALKAHHPTFFFLTHGESSATVVHPIEGIGPLCHKYGTVFGVDTVASLGGTPFHMDKHEVDIVYSGSQKVLSCPPGTAPMAFNETALKKYRNRKTRGPSFYLDFDWLINYWNCEGEARKYHHTGPISSMYCLREGLSVVAEEGLEECWMRHKACAELLYEGLKNLGLELFVKDPKLRLPTVTGILVPSDVDWKAVTSYMMREHRIEISGGLGGSAGRIWRIGLMGYNAQPDNVKRLLRVLKEALEFARNGNKMNGNH